MNASTLSQLDYEIVIVGAGISGIGTAIKLKENGMNSFVLLEKEGELGGTWRDNKYPGVAVDIPSSSYSFSFELNPNWSRVFAPGQEIQEYVQHCAEKYCIKQHIRYHSRVEKTDFSNRDNTWTTFFSDGSQLRSRYIISATGVLNQPVLPNISGIEKFKGDAFHTARWNDSCDLNDKRVAIIGTGASAVQVIPSIASSVGKLSVFQRTPIWVSRKRDTKIRQEYKDKFSQYPLYQRYFRMRSEIFMEAAAFTTVNHKRMPWLTNAVEDHCRGFLKKEVQDPAIRDQLTPHYGFGCKRPAVSNDYLKTFNRDNVDLITEGIQEITDTGVITNDGICHEVDIIIWATGFKTQEIGNAPSFEVYGLDGLELGQYWHLNRYQAYFGVSVPKFPNYFLTYGPYSGGLNWFSMLEDNVKYIIRCLKKAEKKNKTYIEVKQKAHDRYFRSMVKRSNGTVFKDNACIEANSYYLDRHGDASSPSPYTPAQRWFRVRTSRLSAYQFST
ncbi:hypothetical protein A9Q99_19120 [Gammaproteobacteria bacterium 45_16_T64]|nr:hypothetical protein A9Q99_19120 [Gammaproteobacteria bacterium 45_16_T64]